MSGGATFSETSLLHPAITPAEAVRAFVRITSRAKAEGWTREKLRTVLEATALLDYHHKPMTT